MPVKKAGSSDKRRYLPSAERKEEILDAAQEEFTHRTYNAVSIERIAERAGLSKAGIYAHFDSKDEIFHALLNRAIAPLRENQGWLPEGEASLPELLDGYLDRLYAAFQTPASMVTFRLLLAESARVPDLVRRWHQELVQTLQAREQAVIAQYVRRGIVRQSVLTEHFFPLALSPALLWLSSSMLSQGNPSIPLDKLRDIHRQLLLELLRPE